jgi:hypothetical protein
MKNEINLESMNGCVVIRKGRIKRLMCKRRNGQVRPFISFIR